MGDKVATQTFKLKAHRLLIFNIVLEQVFPEGVFASRGGIVSTRWRIPVNTFCGVTARQKGSARSKVDIDILTSISCIVDCAMVAIKGAALCISREVCSAVLTTESIQLYDWAVEEREEEDDDSKY